MTNGLKHQKLSLSNIRDLEPTQNLFRVTTDMKIAMSATCGFAHKTHGLWSNSQKKKITILCPFLTTSSHFPSRSRKAVKENS